MSNHKLITRVCQKCGKEYEISIGSYQQRCRRGSPDYCKECIHRAAAEKAKETKANMSPERKGEYSRRLSEANLNYWKNLQGDALEERQKGLREHVQKLSEMRKNDPEYSAEITRKQQVGRDNMSEEDKLRHKAKMAASMKKHHASKTPEQRKQFSDKVKAGMAKMTDQEKLDMKMAWRNWWNRITDEERDAHMLPSTTALQSYWDNITPEEKEAHLQKLHAGQKEFLENLTPEENRELIAKRLGHGNDNNLQKRFVDQFNSSILSEEYTIIAECFMSGKDKTHHSWDYGIIDRVTGEMVMVVDLDGRYYHADDQYEYDGIRSREEYDEKRSLSVPDGIKWMIIQETKFNECFAQLMEVLPISYKEYLTKIFKECRRIGFPTPKYSDRDLIGSYSQLFKMICDDGDHKSISLNTRIGDHLIQHFHESIWSAHCKGKPSPREAWYNDDLLKKAIRNRTIYQNHLNPNKILQGFNVSKVAPKVSVFSAGRAKMIIHKYLGEYTTIFDPFSGFSGRMLGAVSLDKDYLGQDISEIHVRESNNMITFLQQYGFQINAEIVQANVLDSYGQYPCLFTCPPYGDKEVWLEVPVDKRSCDDWIDICLDHFKCHRYVFVVDKTEKYKEYVVEEIKNRSHMGQNSEYIIVINHEEGV